MTEPQMLQWGHSGEYVVGVTRGLVPAHDEQESTSDAAGEAREQLAALFAGRRVVLVTTPTPWSLHGGAALERFIQAAGADVTVMVENVDEATKTLESVERICARALEHRIGRRDLLVAFGGGVCCDLVSVAAALYRRGVDYVCLPTTLVGQIDAGIGIKGAVNFGGQKSRLGSFHPPVAVYGDPGWLATLSGDALRSGLAEIVKVAVMCDAALFDLVESVGPQLIGSAFQSPVEPADSVLRGAIAGMLTELGLNPFEREGYRRRMDFGHTYSVWLEEESGFRLTHGQAVAVDMALFCEIATLTGRLERGQADRILVLLDNLGLPLTTRWCQPAGVPLAMNAALAHRGGALEMPIPVDIGRADFLPDASTVGDDVVRAAITSLRTRGLRVA